jgi:hypothetical protein
METKKHPIKLKHFIPFYGYQKYYDESPSPLYLDDNEEIKIVKRTFGLFCYNALIAASAFTEAVIGLEHLVK